MPPAIADSILHTMARLLTKAPDIGAYCYARQRIATITNESPLAQQIPTAATTGRQIILNTDFTDCLDRDGRMFVLMHEIMHDIYAHPDIGLVALNRGTIYIPTSQNTLEFNADLFNIAADLRINADIMGYLTVQMPIYTDPTTKQTKPCGLSANWVTDDMSTFDIYERLYRTAKKKTAGGGDESRSGKGAPAGTNVQGEAFDEHAKPDKIESADDRESRAQAIAQAAEVGKLAGVGGGMMSRHVEDRETQISWQDEVVQVLQRITGWDRYDWNRMHRRQFLLTGTVNPTRFSQTVGSVVFIIDTSGSTSGFQDYFVAECASFISDFNPKRAVVLWTDYGPPSVDDLTDPDPAEMRTLEIKGGGGTDLRFGFQWIEDNPDEVPDMQCLVVLTDGYTEWPATEPPYPTIVVVTPDGTTTPDWMQRIDIKG